MLCMVLVTNRWNMKCIPLLFDDINILKIKAYSPPSVLNISVLKNN